MRTTVFLLIAACVFCCTMKVSAHEEHYNLKNYVYDDEGNPVFVKIYIPFEDHQENVCAAKACHMLQAQQRDKSGSYIVVPIRKKKKSEEDDDDENTWECPYCGIVNPASRNVCSNSDCVLYRKWPRDWFRS